jgi:hypothetical protein
MDREPQDTRLPAGPGPGAEGSPPLREFSPATNRAVADAARETAPLALSPDAPPLDAPWSAFIARILRPGSTDTPLRRPRSPSAP